MKNIHERESMKTLFLLSVGTLLLSACAVGDVVLMEHPDTGERVECGGDIAYGNIPAGNDTNLAKQRYCVEDFKQQGYVRVAK